MENNLTISDSYKLRVLKRLCYIDDSYDMIRMPIWRRSYFNQYISVSYIYCAILDGPDSDIIFLQFSSKGI